MNNIKNLRRFALVALVGVLPLSGCEKAFFGSEPNQEALTSFDALWTVIDERYSFFEYKNIDWDAVRDQYRPQVSDDLGSFDLFVLFGDMMNELQDGHANLWAPWDYSRYDAWYRNSPQNFNYTVIDRNYFEGEELITGALRHRPLGNVGYVYYNSFSRTINVSDIEFVSNVYSEADGLIIDIRDNGGGDPENGFRMARRFINSSTDVMQTLMKEGPEHDDFKAANTITLDPEGTFYNKPIVLLTNRSCFSAANDFAAVCKVLPNVTLIGDTTGGGGGIPAEYELPNGWVARFSVSQTLLPDGFNIEHGIPPDIQVDMDPTDEANGIDTILERALAEF